jgi:hypothetical protein
MISLRVRVSAILKLIAILLIVAVALIHLDFAAPLLRFVLYIGVLFIANFVGSLVSAVGIYWDWLGGWVLGVLVAGGSFVGYVVSRLVGLPGFEMAVGAWLNPLGILSLVAEALFVALFVLAVIARRREES